MRVLHVFDHVALALGAYGGIVDCALHLYAVAVCWCLSSLQSFFHGHDVADTCVADSEIVGADYGFGLVRQFLKAGKIQFDTATLLGVWASAEDEVNARFVAIIGDCDETVAVQVDS